MSSEELSGASNEMLGVSLLLARQGNSNTPSLFMLRKLE